MEGYERLFRGVLYALSGVLVMGSSAYAQWRDESQASKEMRQAENDARDQGLKREDQAKELAQKAALAEAIISREETASGRPFDPAFRASIKADLTLRSLEALAEMENRGTGLLPGPKTLGQSGQELVLTPLTPCRIIDTRSAGGPIAAGTTRSFRVTGTNFSGQGGSSGDCGVPVGPATAAVLNFVAVSPSGQGNLRITPFGTAMPTASFLNYAAIGLNVANGNVFAICNPATTTCTNDFTIQASNSTDIVVDVQGYFARPNNVALFLFDDNRTGALDPDNSPVICQTGNTTPTNDRRVFVHTMVSLLTAGAMNFRITPVYSTDGGTTWNFIATEFGRGGASAAGVWATGQQSVRLDLDGGTQYRFGAQVMRDSGTADATDTRCSTLVEQFVR